MKARVPALALHPRHGLRTPHPAGVNGAPPRADAHPTTVTRIQRGRTALEPADWTTARRDVKDSALAWGHPFRPRCLFWEAPLALRGPHPPQLTSHDAPDGRFPPYLGRTRNSDQQ